MRRVLWASVLLVLSLATPAFAQRNSPYGGIDPRMLRSEVVDTSNPVAPIARPQLFNRTFSLANILPSFSSMSAKPILGYSQFPSSDGMPGRYYLKAFGYSRAQPVR
jgi:hypothetical protein